jgi:hypothetical protein
MHRFSRTSNSWPGGQRAPSPTPTQRFSSGMNVWPGGQTGCAEAETIKPIVVASAPQSAKKVRPMMSPQTMSDRQE